VADITTIETEVESLADVIWDMATNVWTFAELGFHEEKSSAYESKVLEEHGFAISDRGIGGIDTSWIATFGSGSPVLGICVEFDALPDLGNEAVPTKTPRKDGVTNGHGCGHNLIGSGAIGAALALKAQMEKDGLPGTLKVFGCPAEEVMAGKNYMAQHGAFSGLDACLHWHPGPWNSLWNIVSAACVDLRLEWHGKSAHAGMMPWDGRSALEAAQLFMHGVDMMRQHVLPTARMHYIVEKGGSAVNVVPDYARVLMRYRGPDSQNASDHAEWLRDIAKAAGMATQTRAEITMLTAAYETLPNQILADRMMAHFERLGPCDWSDEEQAFAKAIQKEVDVPEDGLTTTVGPDPKGMHVGGSSDVGDVSFCTPTMGAIVACWPQHIPAHHWGCTACHGMSIGHKGVIKAAKILAATGLDILTDAALREAATKEWTERTGGKPYRSLNQLDAPIGGHFVGEHYHEGHDAVLAAVAQQAKK
jgi:aminobenzoyl-glutamate utilization protein B